MGAGGALTRVAHAKEVVLRFLHILERNVSPPIYKLQNKESTVVMRYGCQGLAACPPTFSVKYTPFPNSSM